MCSDLSGLESDRCCSRSDADLRSVVCPLLHLLQLLQFGHLHHVPRPTGDDPSQFVAGFEFPDAQKGQKNALRAINARRAPHVSVAETGLCIPTPLLRSRRVPSVNLLARGVGERGATPAATTALSFT